MTGRVILHRGRGSPLPAPVTVCIVLVALLLASGCAEQAGERTTPGNLTSINPGIYRGQPAPALNPTSSFSSGYGETVTVSPGIQTIISGDGIREVLQSWNEKMHWNLSAEQIDEYADSMESGVLEKYRTNPGYPHALYIQDLRQFNREVGLALGFTPEESEAFVQALDDYQRETWQMLDCRDFANNSPCPQRTIPIRFTVKPRPLRMP